MIDQTIQLLIDDAAAVVGTAVKKITSLDELLTPNIVKVVIDKTQLCSLFYPLTCSVCPRFKGSDRLAETRSVLQALWNLCLSKFFLAALHIIGINAARTAEKLEQLRILEHGFRIKVAVTEFDSIPVDTQEDLDRVRAKIKIQHSR